uniref:Myxovirus (influenza virus) resistance G n=1 Tax=Paramormyrops kingsleyae TaxID=1676925 RepID=A0A3B3S2A9_9TELE
MEGVVHSQLEERVRPYIDLVDSLRMTGIERDLSLPAIAVIGDQSSGKSSVLEALSGVSLPRGSGIVTRCPLELKLRRLKGGVQWHAVISYKDEYIEFNDPSKVESYVAKAQNDLAGEGVGICEDLITLEISSQDVCDLTLIDLPGIARVPVKGQPDDIAEQIRSLIMKFIKKRETINLVIVPCNVDIATTEALRMAQEVDPEGKRTLGNETKCMCLCYPKTCISTGHLWIRLPTPVVEFHFCFNAVFFPQTLTNFNEKINRLVSGDVVNEENLFVLLRVEFKKWKDHLDGSKTEFHKIIEEVVDQYDLRHRGRELPGFSNYCVFETAVQKLVVQLRNPALETLRVTREIVQKQLTDVAKNCFSIYPFLQCVSLNKIDNIQSKQGGKVEERIIEQFDMEELVYTQDGIYFKSLTGNTGQNVSADNFSGYDSRLMYPEMLKAYYEIVVQRLADMLPMLIRFFMLKQSAKMLCHEMLKLMDGGNVNEMLKEESDVSRQRAELQTRIDRLSNAQEKINNFY